MPNAVWSAAYVIGQVPSNLILTRVNVPLYIAFLELSGTVFTFPYAGYITRRSYMSFDSCMTSSS